MSFRGQGATIAPVGAVARVVGESCSRLLRERQGWQKVVELAFAKAYIYITTHSTDN